VFRDRHRKDPVLVVVSLHLRGIFSSTLTLRGKIHILGMSVQPRRFLISGKVQGVGYRYFATTVARELRLSGWVRNLPDGRVEALAVGPERQLKRFDSELRIGPLRADVHSVEVAEVGAVDGKLDGFHIR
jgi:acylphosphatase